MPKETELHINTFDYSLFTSNRFDDYVNSTGKRMAGEGVDETGIRNDDEGMLHYRPIGG